MQAGAALQADDRKGAFAENAKPFFLSRHDAAPDFTFGSTCSSDFYAFSIAFSVGIDYTVIKAIPKKQKEIYVIGFSKQSTRYRVESETTDKF